MTDSKLFYVGLQPSSTSQAGVRQLSGFPHPQHPTSVHSNSNKILQHLIGKHQQAAHELDLMLTQPLREL